MELEFVTSFVNFVATALTLGAVTIPLFKKSKIMSSASQRIMRCDAASGVENG